MDHLIPAYRTYFPPIDKLSTFVTARHRVWRGESGKESSSNLRKLYSLYFDKSNPESPIWGKGRGGDFSCVDYVNQLNEKIDNDLKAGGYNTEQLTFELLPDSNRGGIQCIHIKHRDSSEWVDSMNYLPCKKIDTDLYLLLAYFGAEMLGEAQRSCGFPSHAIPNTTWTLAPGKKLFEELSFAHIINKEGIFALRSKEYKGEEKYRIKKDKEEYPLLSQFFTVFSKESEPVDKPDYIDFVTRKDNGRETLREFLQVKVLAGLETPDVIEGIKLTWERNSKDRGIWQARLEATIGGNYEEVGLEISEEMARALNWPLDSRLSNGKYDPHYIANKKASFRVCFRAPISSKGEKRRVSISFIDMPPPRQSINYSTQITKNGEAYGGLAYSWSHKRPPWQNRQKKSSLEIPTIAAGSSAIPEKLSEEDILNGGDPNLRYLSINAKEETRSLPASSLPNALTDTIRFIINEDQNTDTLEALYFEDMRVSVRVSFLYEGGFSLAKEQIKLRQREISHGGLISSVKIYRKDANGSESLLFEKENGKRLLIEDKVLGAFLPQTRVFKNCAQSKGVDAGVDDSGECWSTLVSPIGGLFGKLPKELFITREKLIVELKLTRATDLLVDNKINSVYTKVWSGELLYRAVPLSESLMENVRPLLYQHRILYFPPDWEIIHRPLMQIDTKAMVEWNTNVELFNHKEFTKPGEVLYIAVAFYRETGGRKQYLAKKNIYSIELQWKYEISLNEAFPALKKSEPKDWRYILGANEKDDETCLKEIHKTYVQQSQVMKGVEWTKDQLSNTPIYTFVMPKLLRNAVTDKEARLNLHIKFKNPISEEAHSSFRGPFKVCALLRRTRWIGIDSNMKLFF